MSDNTNKTMNIKNRIFAIDAAPAAKPPNPKIAAITATMRNVIVQRNIVYNLNDKIIGCRFFLRY